MSENKRIRLSDEELALIKKLRGTDDLKNRLTLNPTEREMVESHRAIRQQSESMGLDPSTVKDGWFKTKEASIRFINPLFDGGSLSREDIESVIKDAIKDIEPREYNAPKSDKKQALRAVISDCHVGMDSNDEDALFGFEYNEKIFNNNLNHVFETLKKEINHHGIFDTIFIDDLGDGLDGFDGETTRGGHKLPQNMSNKEAWRVYVENKLQFVIDVINLRGGNKIIFRNVANCNHSGDFGWTANTAIKMIVEKMFVDVDYIILNRHAEHFEYGKHTFILAHGKDKSLMGRNWPLHLTDKLSNIIRQYIDHYRITSPYIHVDKGDLHRVAYDREPRFDYRSYMSFAPPSTWIQANFGVSYCGYSVQIIPKNSNQIQHTDIFFDLKNT